jgi:hypothetical protein
MNVWRRSRSFERDPESGVEQVVLAANTSPAGSSKRSSSHRTTAQQPSGKNGTKVSFSSPGRRLLFDELEVHD